MNFKERLKLINEILKDCPYESQKLKIVELFKKTDSENIEDIILRLIVIDSCYSTNLNRRLFGFEELANLIIIINSNLTKSINVKNFIENNFNLLINTKIGISKSGKSKGHAFSLITKYIYFQTNFNFPIYDSLVLEGLINQNLLIKKSKNPSIDYFNQLIKIKEKENISFDELDKYFWVIGKIRNGSPSLIISNSESYKKDFLEKIFSIDELNTKISSKELDNKIKEKLNLNNINFEIKKLKLIQNLAKDIKINNL